MASDSSRLPALRVHELHAGYPGSPGSDALRGLSLELPQGKILALLGSNGAGKTSLLRCLTGLLPVASGTAQVLGSEVAGTYPPQLLGSLGVLLESPGAYARMTAEDYLGFFGSFYPQPASPDRIQALARNFGFSGLSERMDRLSQGNRRKVQLIRSLLHGPKLVLWDEPTENLDPGSQRGALAQLKEYVAAGASALVTSHRLEQMEELADAFAFLKRGQVVHTIARADLRAGADEAEIEGMEPLDEATLSSLQALAAKRAAQCSSLFPGELRQGSWGLRLKGSEAVKVLPEIIEAAARAGGRVVRAEPLRRTLDALYRRHAEEP